MFKKLLKWFKYRGELLLLPPNERQFFYRDLYGAIDKAEKVRCRCGATIIIKNTPTPLSLRNDTMLIEIRCDFCGLYAGGYIKEDVILKWKTICEKKPYGHR